MVFFSQSSIPQNTTFRKVDSFPYSGEEMAIQLSPSGNLV